MFWGIDIVFIFSFQKKKFKKQSNIAIVILFSMSKLIYRELLNQTIQSNPSEGKFSGQGEEEEENRVVSSLG